MSKAQIFFKNLSGKWHIKRVMGDKGTAEGSVTFISNGSNTLNYREDVQVKWSHSSKPTPAYQQYKYIYDEKSDKIIKYFTDNKIFYRLGFDSKESNKSQATHLCQQDAYNATYTFLTDDKFILSYEVKGPNKDYTIETEFTKVEETTSNLIGVTTEEV